MPRYVVSGPQSMMFPGGVYVQNGQFVPDGVSEDAIKLLLDSGEISVDQKEEKPEPEPKPEEKKPEPKPEEKKPEPKPEEKKPEMESMKRSKPEGK